MLRVKQIDNGKICRSSRPEVFCKKDFLKNFPKFTEINANKCEQLLLD